MDRQPFGLQAFTGKLLANTGGAGGAFEIMPQLNGQDAFPDPLMYDAAGYAGNKHIPAHAALSGYDTYVIHLWVDWALVGLTVIDANPLLPASLQITETSTNSLQISWSADAVGYVPQKSPSLEPANWTMVTNTAQVASGSVHVTVPRSGSAGFFRLQAIP